MNGDAMCWSPHALKAIYAHRFATGMPIKDLMGNKTLLIVRAAGPLSDQLGLSKVDKGVSTCDHRSIIVSQGREGFEELTIIPNSHVVFTKLALKSESTPFTAKVNRRRQAGSSGASQTGIDRAERRIRVEICTVPRTTIRMHRSPASVP